MEHSAQASAGRRAKLGVIPWLVISLASLVSSTTLSTLLVRTDVQLVEALRDRNVTVISVFDNLTLTPETFNQMVPAGQPILVDRNVTLRGGPGLPVLDMEFISGRVSLAPGVVFTFEQLFLHRERLEAATQGPDLFAYSPNASVVLHQCWLLWESCYPVELWQYWTINLFTQIGGPGVPPVPYNRNHSATVLANGVCHAATQRCWKNAGFLDAVVEMWATEQPRVPGTGWAYWASNSTFVCNCVVSFECIQVYSLKTCLGLMRGGNDWNSGTPGILKSTAPPVAPLKGSQRVSNANHSNSNDTNGGVSKLAVALSAALGGAAVLAGLAALLVLWRVHAARKVEDEERALDAMDYAVSPDGRCKRVLASRGHGSNRETEAGYGSQAADEIAGSCLSQSRATPSSWGTPRHTAASGRVQRMEPLVTASSLLRPKRPSFEQRGCLSSEGSASCMSTSVSTRPSAARIPESAPPPVQAELRYLLQSLAASGSGDRLVVQESIAQGGHGTVYKGVWRNRAVAVKTIFFSYSTEALEQQHEHADRPRTAPISQLTYPKRPCSQLPAALSETFDRSMLDEVAKPQQQKPQRSQQQAEQQQPQQQQVEQLQQQQALTPDPSHQSQAARPHQRALWEAAVCSSIVHPNIVATYHYDVMPVQTFEEAHGLVGGLQIDDTRSGAHFKLYLVQEYCPTNLAHLNESQRELGRLPVLGLLSLLRDIARGLEHLHDRNIVHGDLSPHNILLQPAPFTHSTPETVAVAVAAAAAQTGPGAMAAAAALMLRSGTPLVAKLCDFGLSHALDPGRTHVSDVRQGTPFYNAPEVVKSRKLTPQSDVWSFGTIAWEAFHCTPPWVAEPEEAPPCPCIEPRGSSSSRSATTATAYRYRWHPDFACWAPGAPRELARLAMACHAEEAGRRPSAAQLAQQLGQLLTSLLMQLPAVTAPAAPPAPRAQSPEQPGLQQEERVAASASAAARSLSVQQE